jgi:hypothetical protein
MRVTVTLLTADRGGRIGPLPAGRHSCLCVVGTQRHDCRLSYSDNLRPAPGETFEAELTFVFAHLVQSYPTAGGSLDLYERSLIGTATVI